MQIDGAVLLAIIVISALIGAELHVLFGDASREKRDDS